jgi:hypothetical protein
MMVDVRPLNDEADRYEQAKRSLLDADAIESMSRASFR